MRLRAVCASILIAAVVAPCAVAQDGVATIDACLKRVDPQSGYAQVGARCPDLIRRLEASNSAAWLPAGWSAPSTDLSAASLMDLRRLIAHELSLRAPSRPPDVVALKQILAGLGPPVEPQTTGPWTRFTRWLRAALERPDPASADSWWGIARASPSQTLIDVVCYSGLAIVVAMAFALVMNELRVAGFFRRRRRHVAGGAGVRPTARVASDWSAIQSAPALDRPRLLLELISARLVELNRLPPAGAFTVRELMQQAQSVRGEDRSFLAEVALAAERVRFSGQPVPAATLETVIDHGRRLLEHLSS